MDNNTALQLWGLMVAYFPWIVGVFLLLVLLIFAALTDIGGNLKKIAERLQDITYRLDREKSLGASKGEESAVANQSLTKNP
jgi:hypothetical protein